MRAGPRHRWRCHLFRNVLANRPAPRPVPSSHCSEVPGPRRQGWGISSRSYFYGDKTFFPLQLLGSSHPLSFLLEIFDVSPSSTYHNILWLRWSTLRTLRWTRSPVTPQNQNSMKMKVVCSCPSRPKVSRLDSLTQRSAASGLLVLHSGFSRSSSPESSRQRPRNLATIYPSG